MRDHHAPVHECFSLGRDIICHAPRRSGYGVQIHAAGTCSQLAAQACCTKTQILIKALPDLLFFPGAPVQVRAERILLWKFLKPFFIVCKIFHTRTSL